MKQQVYNVLFLFMTVVLSVFIFSCEKLDDKIDGFDNKMDFLHESTLNEYFPIENGEKFIYQSISTTYDCQGNNDSTVSISFDTINAVSSDTILHYTTILFDGNKFNIQKDSIIYLFEGSSYIEKEYAIPFLFTSVCDTSWNYLIQMSDGSEFSPVFTQINKLINGKEIIQINISNGPSLVDLYDNYTFERSHGMTHKFQRGFNFTQEKILIEK